MAKFIDRTEERNINSFGSEMIITRYKNNKDIDVYFPKYDWTAFNVQYGQFTKGEIKCPYEPRLCNIGYQGEGSYESEFGKNYNKAYRAWRNMIERCYNKKIQSRQKAYIGCTVCDEWHNFQNFAEWFYDNYYEIPGEVMYLDKDILTKGNKIYSPDNCTFVSNRINVLFIKHDKDRGEYPIGVYHEKTRKNKLVAQCQIYENGKIKRKFLGYFELDQVEEAFLSYKTFKEAYIKSVANEYKDLIPQSLYDAMYNYEVDYDD